MAESDYGQYRVLIADDDQLQLEVTANLVRAVGAECDCAGDGDEAFRMLAAADGPRYDLLLTDIFMPGMTGFELADRFRASDHQLAQTMPILGVSAYTDPDLYDRAISAGMNGMTLKPLTARVISAYFTLLLGESRVNSVFAARLHRRIESERNMREFASGVCHNLRAPLKAIMGFAEMLGMPDVPEEDRKNWAGAIARACQSASKLLNDTQIAFADA